MPARFTLLGALHSPPTAGRFTLAGTETTNIRGAVREVRFYHRLTADPEALPDLPLGTPLLVEGYVCPNKTNDGTVQLHPTLIHPLPPLPTTRDSLGGYVLTTGLNHVLASGRLATDVRPQTLPGADGVQVVNISLILAPDLGLLETTSYGHAATPLLHGHRGEEVVLFGRLHAQTRPDSSGARRTYTRLETYRPTRHGH